MVISYLQPLCNLLPFLTGALHLGVNFGDLGVKIIKWFIAKEGAKLEVCFIRINAVSLLTR